ncbi:MAG: hypothetical protein WA817_22160 [Candidatus Acidiferrum sp.]
MPEKMDAAFQGMAEDEDYQSEALQIAEEFAASDLESLKITEQDMSQQGPAFSEG